MVQLDSGQRVFFVANTYFETRSFWWSNSFRFPGRNPPARMTIWRNIKKYTDHATSLNRNKGNSGRQFTVRTQDTVDAVQFAIRNNPRGVTCRINGLGLTKSTFNRIVAKYLKWHPYKIHKRQQLKDGDFEWRMGFCEWLLIQNRNSRFLHDLMGRGGFSYERKG